MKGRLKILTFNLRFFGLLLLFGSLIGFYVEWTLASLALLLICTALLLVSFRYKIGSVGIDSRVLGLNLYRYVFLVKLTNSNHEESSSSNSNNKDKIRVFTFGLFLLADNGKMRAGFLKRHQLLAKAWI
jgi:hypothetical protein